MGSCLFWIFVWYSFLGFLLEVAFARITRHPKRDRKCFLLLPLCPVYGVGALMIRGMNLGGGNVLWVAVAGFLAATAAELLLGAFYRYVLGVEFWNYRTMKYNLAGLVCLRFSLYWAGLALVMVYGLDPLIWRLSIAVPDVLTVPAAIVVAADGLVTVFALKRTGSTRVLQWYRG